MSEMEAHKGRLVPITNLPGRSVEGDAEELCSRLGYTKEIEYGDGEEYDSWLECLTEKGYRQVHLIDGVFYQIFDTDLDPEGFIEGTKNEDGSYDYAVHYHNGGASFYEIMQAVVRKANRGA